MAMTSNREAACPAMKVIFGACGKNAKGAPLFPYHNMVGGICTACHTTSGHTIAPEKVRLS